MPLVKSKKPRNLTVARWEKQVAQEAEAASLKSRLDHDKGFYESQLEALRSAVKRAETAGQEKNAVIQRQSEDLQRAASRATELVAERDRIMRVVDQFTSIAITPMHAAAHGVTNCGDSPKSLRRT